MNEIKPPFYAKSNWSQSYNEPNQDQDSQLTDFQQSSITPFQPTGLSKYGESNWSQSYRKSNQDQDSQVTDFKQSSITPFQPTGLSKFIIHANNVKSIVVFISVILLNINIAYASIWYLSSSIAILGIAVIVLYSITALAVNIHRDINLEAVNTSDPLNPEEQLILQKVHTIQAKSTQITDTLLVIIISIAIVGFILNSFFNIPIIGLHTVSVIMTCLADFIWLMLILCACCRACILTAAMHRQSQQ
jgi:hypothetical protein